MTIKYNANKSHFDFDFLIIFKYISSLFIISFTFIWLEK